APAGALQAVEPGPRAWKQVDAALAHERAVAPLLAVADPLDLGGREDVAEQAPEDGGVALAERIGGLSGGEVVRGRSHRLAPGDPVQRRGIDERAVEVPEHAAGNVVARLGVALLRFGHPTIIGHRQPNAGTARTPGPAGLSGRGKPLPASGRALARGVAGPPRMSRQRSHLGGWVLWHAAWNDFKAPEDRP